MSRCHMHANKVDEYIVHKQVCVQLPTSADNVTLLAFAAKCSAAVRRAAAAVDRWNVRTDRETDKRYRDPAHTFRAVSIIQRA